jgi:hypothetical protein
MFPCYSMVHSQVADGGDSLHLWKVAANLLSKEFQTVHSWQWVFLQYEYWGGGLITSHHKKIECYKMLHRVLYLDEFYWMT